jgi:hypothetical protein
MAMKKFFFCFTFFFLMSAVAQAKNNFTIEMKQASPLSNGEIKLKVYVKSLEKTDITIPLTDLPSSPCGPSIYAMIILVDGVGESFPKYMGCYPPQDLVLRKGETIIQEMTVKSKLLIGKDAKKSRIEFIWIENAKTTDKNAGVLAIF